MNFTKVKATSNDVSFITQVYENRKKPILVTESIQLEYGPLYEKDFIKFIIKKSQAPNLYKAIKTIEEQVIQSMRVISNDFFQELPEQVQETLSRKYPDSGLRSNYLDDGENEPIMFLKGKVDTIKYTQDGKVISPNSLAAGTYQFKINADTIYCGPHGKPEQAISLMLRIIEIQYNPNKTHQDDLILLPSTGTPTHLAIRVNRAPQATSTPKRKKVAPYPTTPLKQKKVKFIEGLEPMSLILGDDDLSG